jgi:hypothetical protein
MPLVTRGDVEALYGVERVQQLLREAGSDPAKQDERMDVALKAADMVIAQFLPLPTDPDDPRVDVLREISRAEAFYTLQKSSRTGAPREMHEEAQIRRADLAHMRDRKQMPGAPVKQGNVPSGYVENTAAWSRSKLGGLV